MVGPLMYKVDVEVELERFNFKFNFDFPFSAKIFHLVFFIGIFLKYLSMDLYKLYTIIGFNVGRMIILIVGRHMLKYKSLLDGVQWPTNITQV